MSLNESKGNMYEFITHTWNPIKGKCYHNCSYCYMRQERLKPARVVESEFNTDLGQDNFIFVGSSIDLFNETIKPTDIEKILLLCSVFPNKYLFQTKNPSGILKIMERHERFMKHNLSKFYFAFTIESDINYPDIMRNSPKIEDRLSFITEILKYTKHVLITIEPILDFYLDRLIDEIKYCKPMQVNIGADSKRHNLPEPSAEKILALIKELRTFTHVHCKSNLKRLIDLK